MHQKHYPKLSAMNLEITSLIQHKTDIWREHLKKQWDYKKNMYTIKNHTWPRQQKAYPNTESGPGYDKNLPCERRCGCYVPPYQRGQIFYWGYL